jgi:hypothetical protein
VRVLDNGRLRDHAVRVVPTLPGSLLWAVCVRGFLQSTAFMERAALEELGGYRELPVTQDHRLWCQLARRRWLQAIPEPLVHWRAHDHQLSVERRELQGRLGAEIVREHLSELTGREWTQAEADRLYFIGRRPSTLREGLGAIAAFERLWKSDASLDRAEREELSRLTRRLRSEHVKDTTRRALDAFPPGRFILGTYRRARVARQH